MRSRRAWSIATSASTVTAFAVPHGAWEQAFGYRFQTPDRTIVISGDTGAESRIEDQCRRCDVLVHEVYSEAGFAKRPPEWQAYHCALSHVDARSSARSPRARSRSCSVLYHQLIWSSTEEELLKEVRSAYDGKVVSAHDLDVLTTRGIRSRFLRVLSSSPSKFQSSPRAVPRAGRAPRRGARAAGTRRAPWPSASAIATANAAASPDDTP